ncbi:uncharacterized protein LOC131073095 isoform X1 [Cryptomeria japonica]|uniref:uncharacterized protein LOC131073095 isoform X1 n=1 Tax=Cryptomeria japonica TaxID=3369 RepID=UPI0025ACFC26|nr:uncharacterized protein LOC131073095 isoform X1 [Cryptomeria japonica]
MEAVRSYRYHVEYLTQQYSMTEQKLWFASTIVGLVMCRIAYGITKLTSLLYFKGYAKLTKMEQIEWNNRGFSTIHAIVVSAASIYLLFISDLFYNNDQDEPIILRSSFLSNFILGVSVGYFLSDLAMIFWHYPSLGGKEYILHHGFSMTAIGVSLYSSEAQIYVYMILLSEITTPFVNARWYLDLAGLKRSKAYLINGIALFFGWLVARIILFIFYFAHVHLHYDEVTKVKPATFYCLFTVPSLLTFMNVYWFWRIARGCTKTLSKRQDD